MIRATVAATVAVGLCATVVVAAEIDVGGITASMTFEEVQAEIGPGSIECEHTLTTPAIERMCHLVIETDTQIVAVSKDPAGTTIYIRRTIPLPDALTIEDAFEQLVEKYGGRGHHKVHIPRFMALFACPAECTIADASIVATAETYPAWGRALAVQFSDRQAENRNTDRMKAEIEAAKPRLPL